MTQTRIRIIDATTPGVPRDHDRFNVNGPSVLPAPGWMPAPPGRYLMFFAHHLGLSIRLAAADDPTGPWRVVEPDVLHVDDTPSDRQPHIASPDVHADDRRQRFVMYFHGMVPSDVGGHLACWGTYPTLNQKTMVTTSHSGRHFALVEPVTAVAPSYLRMFDAGDAWYGVAMPSQVVRSADGLRGFEYGPMLFDDDEIRHCCLSHRPERQRTGDAVHTLLRGPRAHLPHRDRHSRATGASWSPGPGQRGHAPEQSHWEGADEALKPAFRGAGRSRLARTAFATRSSSPTGGRRWLFYAAAGEYALGVTEISQASSRGGRGSSPPGAGSLREAPPARWCAGSRS